MSEEELRDLLQTALAIRTEWERIKNRVGLEAPLSYYLTLTQTLDTLLSWPKVV